MVSMSSTVSTDAYEFTVDNSSHLYAVLNNRSGLVCQETNIGFYFFDLMHVKNSLECLDFAHYIFLVTFTIPNKGSTSSETVVVLCTGFCVSFFHQVVIHIFKGLLQFLLLGLSMVDLENHLLAWIS